MYMFFFLQNCKGEISHNIVFKIDAEVLLVSVLVLQKRQQEPIRMNSTLQSMAPPQCNRNHTRTGMLK